MSGKGSRLLAKLGAKPTGGIKRPTQDLLSSKPPGPTAKKANTVNFLRKNEEGSVKEKKEPKPIFEIETSWKKNDVETLTDLTDFDRLATNFTKDAKDEIRANEKFILAVIRHYIESDKTDNEWVSRLSIYINIHKKQCISINIVQALFELLPHIEARELIPSLAGAISTIIAEFESYPLLLFKLVINDSCGKRLWVDQNEAVQACYSIISIFGDFIIPSDELYEKADIPWAKKRDYDASKYPCKFDKDDESTKEVVQEAIDKIAVRCEEEANKSLIRTIIFITRNPKIQQVVIKNLEAWLGNVKLQRSVLDLIVFFTCNITEVESLETRQILKNLISKQSFRHKQNGAVLHASIDALYERFPQTMEIFIDTAIEVDFAMNHKVNHQYSLMHHLFSLDATEASKVLANRVIHHLQQSRTAKPIKTFIREFTKNALRGTDFLFDEFAKHCFEAVKEKVLFIDDDIDTAELFKSVVNLCALLPLSAVVSSVKESGALRRTGNALTSSQAEVLTRYHGQLKKFLAVSVEFIKFAVSTSLCSNTDAYFDAYQQLLYLGGYKLYATSTDAWPTEGEYNSVIRTVQECVIDDSVLLPLVTLDRNQISSEKTLNILDCLTARALSLFPLPTDHHIISVKNLQTIEKLLELSSVDEPGSDSNKMCNRLLYQRAWFLALKWLILSEHDILKEAYERYPLLKMLLHMIVINHFEFPLPSLNGKSARELEADNIAQEKTELDIVSAAQLLKPVKTESPSKNSIDPLTTYCLFNPTGIPRKLPELFANLQNFAKDYPVAIILCSVKNFDILESLVKDNLGDYALPVIQKAINLSPSLVETLPLRSLGQLFFFDFLDHREIEEVSLEKGLIRTKLQRTLIEKSENAIDLIDFFLSKLCAHSFEERQGALRALQVLIGDSSTADHPVNAFANLPVFESVSDKICRDLSYSITIENDMQIIMDNISFIARHMKSGDTHLIASRLTRIVERIGGSSDMHKQVHYALLDFFASYLKTLLNQTATAIPGDSKDEILQIKIPQHSNDFKISSKVLTGMMTLLCEGSDEDTNSNRELLLNTWFGDTAKEKLSVRRVSDNAEVNILPDSLKQKMLASTDERIVDAALLGMTVDCALGFLKSSAITNLAYSKLLALVNANKPPKGNLQSVANVVRAYKLKGVKGADEFLDYVNAVEGTTNTPEIQTVNHKALALDPAPTFETSLKSPDIMVKSKELYTFDSADNAVRYITSILSRVDNLMDVVDKNWYTFTKAIRKGDIASEIAAYIIAKKDKIPLKLMIMMVSTFLDGYRINPTLFAPILTRLAEAFNDLPDIRIMLQQHAIKDVEMADSSTDKELKDLSADEILTKFSRMTPDTPKFEITCLILRYRKICPEIIDSNLSPKEFKRKLYNLFSAKIPAAVSLVEDLATSSSRPTVKKVLEFLLESYEPSVNASLVISFVDKCVTPADTYLQIIPTSHQTVVLIDYVLADMISDIPTKSIIFKFQSVLQALSDKYGSSAFKEVLQNIGERLEISLRPPMDEPLVIVLNRLIDELAIVFYGCREVVEQFQRDNSNFTKKSKTPKTLITANLEAYFAIIEVCAATESQESARIEEATQKLMKLCSIVPRAVASYLEVLSDRMAPILTMSEKKYREHQFIRLLEVSLEVALATAPYSYNCYQSLNFLLKPFLEFFYTRITYSQRFEKLFDLLVNTCLGYIIENPIHGKEFLKDEANFFKEMQSYYKFEALPLLTRQIEQLILKQ